jgi:hypothetical protein
VVVRSIYRYRTQSLGWADVGCNLLVDRFGTIYQGRGGGLDKGVVGHMLAASTPTRSASP